jgi:hypothetical protein
MQLVAHGLLYIEPELHVLFPYQNGVREGEDPKTQSKNR